MTIHPRCLQILLLVTATLRPAAAHDGPHDEPDAEPARSQAAIAGPALVLPVPAGPAPWTEKPVFDDPDRFQIAIMTDRTGGHRPGVWMDAVGKLNLLRPAFVMSVGDLIEGYTEDRDLALRQWKEFTGFVDRLDMKFFFVAGNHDLTNPMLQELWREKFGPTWYAFDYKRVHFLCLCSEDPLQRIGPDQLAFIREDLAAHADARHTLVFLHKPLWNIAERDLAAGNPDSTNWKQVEALLADRPHTVFAGHIHHYVQYRRNGGRKYYALATTGGGSQLRGPAYGEFDHVTWLTMEADGPQVVNLALDGILPADVVTEERAERFRAFLTGSRVEVAPILVEQGDGFAEGDLHVRLTNGGREPVAVEGDFEGLPLRGLTVDPERVRLAAGPGESAERSVRVRFGATIPFDRLAAVVFRARLRSPGPDGLFAERLVPVVIDQRRDCPRLAGPPRFAAAGWPVDAVGTGDTPTVLGAAADWKGPADGSFAFAPGHDDEHLVLDVRVTDERIEAGDAVEFFIDPRPARARHDDPRMRRYTLRVVANAPDADGRSLVEGFLNHRPLAGCSATGRRRADGYDLRIEMPIRFFGNHASPPRSDFLLAGMLRDVDEPDAPAAEILWRGSPSIRERNDGYAVFAWSE